MAYIKYKELTKYYNFSKELDIRELPNEVYAYIENGEEILIAYSTYNDMFLLTTHKLIIIDVYGIMGQKKRVHFFPFLSISSSAIEFSRKKSSIFLSMDSGYQVQLNFVRQGEEEQNKIRNMYMRMLERVSQKRV